MRSRGGGKKLCNRQRNVCNPISRSMQSRRNANNSMFARPSSVDLSLYQLSGVRVDRKGDRKLRMTREVLEKREKPSIDRGAVPVFTADSDPRRERYSKPRIRSTHPTCQACSPTIRDDREIIFRGFDYRDRCTVSMEPRYTRIYIYIYSFIDETRNHGWKGVLQNESACEKNCPFDCLFRTLLSVSFTCISLFCTSWHRTI